MQFIPDIPIENPEQDYMNHSEHAKNLVDILLEAIKVGKNQSLNIAILGDWGSGKSGFLNLMKHFLEENGQSSFVNFDAWEHEQAESLLVPLVRCARETDKAAALTAGAIGESAVRILLDTALSWIKAPDTKKIGETFENARKKRMLDEPECETEKKILEEAIFDSKSAKSRGKKKLAFFFIDNLDRCNPDNAMRLLESVKCFLNIPGCIWIFAVDPVALSAFIKKKYHGAGFGTYAYLEKIFSFTYQIPTPDTKNIRNYGREKIELPRHVSRFELDWLMTIFSKSRKLSVPRRMNRALMRLDLYCKAVKEDDVSGTPILGGIIWICIYEGWPELYLWARNNILTFTWFMKACGKGIVGNDAEITDMGTGSRQPVPDIINLTMIPEEFRNDENFRDLMHNLFLMAFRTGQTMIGLGEEIGEPIKNLIKSFIIAPNQYLPMISVTGIP